MLANFHKKFVGETSLENYVRLDWFTLRFCIIFSRILKYM